jgi:hypothetical protein
MESPKKTRVADKDFRILKYNEYESLLVRNYKISQLKTMSRFYKEHTSGNKKVLVARLYNFLRRASSSLTIQKHWRGYIRRTYTRLRGLYVEGAYVNDTDFLTLDSIANIPYGELFILEDNGCKFAFSAKSFFNLIYKNDEPRNPYTRKPIDKGVIDTFYKFVIYSNILNEPVSIEIDTEVMSEQHNINMKIQNTFNKIDSFGHITDTTWFNSLDGPMLKKLIMELIDIWEYRADIHIDIKKAIYPPNGTPFLDISDINQQGTSMNFLKTIVIRILDRFIFGEQGHSNQSLGAYYILCALTLVSQSAANALPWLYQSVAYS